MSDQPMTALPPGARFTRKEVTNLVRAAEAAARERALEDAAVVAWDHECEGPGPCDCASRISKDIRRLGGQLGSISCAQGETT